MKSGVSLQQMLTEVKRQSESKEDYLIAPNRLRMESYGKEMFLHLSDDSGTELIEPMTITGIIDTAIDLMRRKHKKGEFYYWILYYAYLSPQQCENAGAILQLLETKGISISLRTYYVHRDEAIEVLSSILWGYTSQDCEKITNLLTPD